MPRYIDAVGLVENMLELREHLPRYRERCVLRKALRCVEESPTVDAEPVRHGSWYYGECSVCKGICIHYKPPYCPNCGAKMDGDEHAAD